MAKIAIDLSFVDDRPTGVTNYSLGLADALCVLNAPGYDLLAWDGVRVRQLGEYLRARDSSTNLTSKLSQRGLTRLRDVPLAHAAARWIRARLAPRFEFFHAMNFAPTFEIVGEIIPTVYDLSFLRYPQHSPPERVARLERATRCFRAARAVHTISHFTKAELQELLGIAPDRIFVIPPAAATPSDDADNDASVLPGGLRADAFLLYVGSLEPRKNLGTLVRAYLALNERARVNCPLVLAGPTGWHDAGLPPSAAEAIARGEIVLPGYLPTATLRHMMRAARALVFPSVYEGFGMPVLEALCEGTPVIISANAGLDEASCGLGTTVPALDVDAWRAALADAMSVAPTPEQRQALRTAARQQFSWERSAVETVRMYASLT